MATLKSIRKRIASTKSTEKLTHAMKMIATSRMRRAMATVLEARVFNTENERILAELIKRSTGIDDPLIAEKEKRSNIIDMFVITSDRGLCGAFNENLLKHLLSFLRSEETSGRQAHLRVAGKKGRDFFRRHDIKIEATFEMSGLYEEMNASIERFRSGAIDGAMVAFNKFRNIGSSEIAIQRILPATPPEAAPEYVVDYIYEPDQKSVLSFAVESMIRSNFLLAFLESTAAELSARMIAMDKATKNAEELIIGLTMAYNKARQAAITSELIDIVGGSEALK